MTEIDRRKAILLALSAPLAPYAIGAAGEQTQEHQHKMPTTGSVHWMGDEQIAMLMYPGMTVMDLMGPHCFLGALMGAKVFLVAKSLDPVTSDTGVTITPTATFKTCPRDLTVLFTPGGTDGTLAAAVDPETRAFMADRGARAKYVTSVCSGSLILGAVGLLKGYKDLALVGAPCVSWIRRDSNRRSRCARPQPHHGRGRDRRAGLWSYHGRGTA